MGGKRSRLALVRRFSLSFEVRMSEGARRAELWIFAEECIHRWEIPAEWPGAERERGSLATQLPSFPLWAVDANVPPRRDRGRCVVDAHSIGRLRDAVSDGELSFWLQGERLHGAFRLEKTPLALAGRAQWRLRAEESGATEAIL
jgi:hypothetical protein